MFDYACKVSQAFNGWLVGVIAEFVDANLMVAATGMVTTPPPPPGIEQAWSTSLAVTNTVYVLVVTAAGVLMTAYQTVQTSAGVKELAPRLVLGFVGANASWFLCELLADIGNAVSLRLLSGTATPDNVAETIGRILEDPVGELLIVLLLFAVAGLLQLFFFFALLIRIMLWILLTAAAPLALACHALPQTDGLARLWWRAMGALLLVQVTQALTLRIAMTIFLSREDMDFIDPEGLAGSLADVGVLICCMYILVRIPFWAFKRVFNYQTSPVLKAAKFALSVLVLRNIGRAMAGRAAARSGGAGGIRPGGRGGGGPGGGRPWGPPSGGAGHRRWGRGNRYWASPGFAPGSPPRPAPGGGISGGPARGLSGPAQGSPGSSSQRSSERWSSGSRASASGSARSGTSGSGARSQPKSGRGFGSGAFNARQARSGGRHFPGGYSQHRPDPPPQTPPPDPRRHRSMRPAYRLHPPSTSKNVPTPPTRPMAPPRTPPSAAPALQKRPIRPKPRHYQRPDRRRRS
ncbi:hypothetical protein HDA32_005119 [Spinactinospora alkalitolerans]|uniref:Uncharacterized protein n=1 Tax=Spinactinospora alkalitolerans TaxID=687207 RepID=A0A852U1B4_9ACTN|nr:hypothetical protein [Spinactinospora alkalitolerans]NYE49999.1 hypothetical protein [Spinactinospora alkalitolerans]